jgi:hypothetical protein
MIGNHLTGTQKNSFLPVIRCQIKQRNYIPHGDFKNAFKVPLSLLSAEITPVLNEYFAIISPY